MQVNFGLVNNANRKNFHFLFAQKEFGLKPFAEDMFSTKKTV